MSDEGNPYPHPNQIWKGDLDYLPLDKLAEAAHEAWFAEKARRGVESWPNEHGFEQMVHWNVLSEDVREFDRVVVRAIVRQIKEELG